MKTLTCTCGAPMHPVEWVGRLSAKCILCNIGPLGPGVVYECDKQCGGKACSIHAKELVFK